MSKKASIFESELFKIILAVICLGLLIFLAAKLYGIFIKQSASEQAKENFLQLTAKMKGLNGNDSFLIVNPVNWNLMSDGDRVCICSFEKQTSPDFFRSEKRDAAMQNCIENGFCDNIANVISQYDSCGWGAFSSCIDMKKLPLTVYLEKKDNKVYIRLNEEINLVRNADNFLDFKKDDKSIREIILDFIANGLDLGVSDRIAIGNQINDIFTGYADSIDTKQVFGINRENLAWSLKLYKLDDNNQISGIYFFNAETYKTYLISKPPITSYVDFNGYRLVINIWEGK